MSELELISESVYRMRHSSVMRNPVISQESAQAM